MLGQNLAVSSLGLNYKHFGGLTEPAVGFKLLVFLVQLLGSQLFFTRDGQFSVSYDTGSFCYLGFFSFPSEALFPSVPIALAADSCPPSFISSAFFD